MIRAITITKVNGIDSSFGRFADFDNFNDGSWGSASLHPRLYAVGRSAGLVAVARPSIGQTLKLAVPVKSVPPRDSGWVSRLPIAQCQLPIGHLRNRPIGNRKLT